MCHLRAALNTNRALYVAREGVPVEALLIASSTLALGRIVNMHMYAIVLWTSVLPLGLVSHTI